MLRVLTHIQRKVLSAYNYFSGHFSTVVGVNGSDSRTPVSVTSFDVTAYYGLNALQMKDLILSILSAGVVFSH